MLHTVDSCHPILRMSVFRNGGRDFKVGTPQETGARGQASHTGEVETTLGLAREGSLQWTTTTWPRVQMNPSRYRSLDGYRSIGAPMAQRTQDLYFNARWLEVWRMVAFIDKICTSTCTCTYEKELRRPAWGWGLGRCKSVLCCFRADTSGGRLSPVELIDPCHPCTFFSQPAPKL